MKNRLMRFDGHNWLYRSNGFVYRIICKPIFDGKYAIFEAYSNTGEKCEEVHTTLQKTLKYIDAETGVKDIPF